MNKIANFLIATQQNDYQPPVLSFKAFFAYGLILLLLRLLLGVLPAQSAAVESGVLMSLINEERERRNLHNLSTDQSLLVAAGQKSQDMIDRDYFAHVDPEGNYIWEKVKAAGYRDSKILGENLAVDFTTAEGMIKAWLESPAHRDNLLHGEFLDQGLAALYGDFQNRFTNLTTSLFGARQTSAPRPPSPVVKGDLPPSSPPAPLQRATLPAPAIPQETAKKIESIPASSTNSFLKFRSGYDLSKIIFTIFGIFLLGVLAIDSIIIYRHALQVQRSHSSYHFFSLMLITLVSILIWWW